MSYIAKIRQLLNQLFEKLSKTFSRLQNSLHKQIELKLQKMLKSPFFANWKLHCSWHFIPHFPWRPTAHLLYHFF